MSETRRRHVTRLTLVALVLALTAPSSEAGGARLEGYVLGVDGRAATGYRIHLVDDEGRDVAQAATTDEGIYRFRDLSSGAYSVGIESPEGRMSPVAAPPIRLAADELARRDIKLVEADEAQRAAVSQDNNSFGVFWAGLSPLAKAGTVIGVFIILGVTIKALDDDEKRGTRD
jgi:hypothetical protein